MTSGITLGLLLSFLDGLFGLSLSLLLLLDLCLLLFGSLFLFVHILLHLLVLLVLIGLEVGNLLVDLVHDGTSHLLVVSAGDISCELLLELSNSSVDIGDGACIGRVHLGGTRRSGLGSRSGNGSRCSSASWCRCLFLLSGHLALRSRLRGYLGLRLLLSNFLLLRLRGRSLLFRRLRSWLRLDDWLSDRLGLGRRQRFLDRLLDLDGCLCLDWLRRSDRLTLENVDLSVVLVVLLLKSDSGANRGDAGSNGACGEEEDSHVKILRV